MTITIMATQVEEVVPLIRVLRPGRFVIGTIKDGAHGVLSVGICTSAKCARNADMERSCVEMRTKTRPPRVDQRRK